jgi:tetratricopeptide (TPR) repeat protein
MRYTILALIAACALAQLGHAQAAAEYNNQGIAAYEQKNFPLAISLFEQAYDGARDNDTVRHNLCNALQAQADQLAKEADFAAAAKHLETAIGVDPSNPAPLTQLGAYYLRLDMVPDAILRLEEAIELKPGQLDAHELLGRAYYADNDLASAMAQWDYVLAKEPGRKDLTDLYTKAKREAAVEGGFKRRGSRHFSVSYPSGIPNEIRARVMSILEGAYLQVGGKFGKAFPPTPIQVVIYDVGQFQEATNLDKHVGAVFDGKIRAPLTDDKGEFLPDDEIKRRLTHEYVHVVIRYLAGMNVPWWINEGFAEVFSSEIDDNDRNLLQKASEEGKLFKLSQLQKSQLMSRTPEQLAIAYAQAQTAATYLWQRYGQKRLISMMSDLSAGMEAEEALKKHYSRTYADLDKEIAEKYR